MLNSGKDTITTLVNQPGGKFGVFVAAIAAGVGLYFLVPILFAITSLLVKIACGVGFLAILLFLATNKQIKISISVAYFLFMRKLMGLFVKIDPIAIVERRLLDMKKKIQQITKAMGDLKGYIKLNEGQVIDTKKDIKDYVYRVDVAREQGNKGQESTYNKQVVRLTELLQSQQKCLEDSNKWYSILSKLEEMASLTVEDTENDIKIRKQKYLQIRQQYQAYKSVMSVMKGDPDEMALFNQGMDEMLNDINSKVGEMEHVLESTGGLISQYSTDSAVADKKAEELLQRYNEHGIDGLFDTFDKKPISQISQSFQIPLSNVEKQKNKYF